MLLRRDVLTSVLLVGLSVMAHGSSPTDQLAVTIEIHGHDSSFGYAAIDPTMRQLYVARGDGVMRVDLVTKRVTPTLVPGNDVHAVVLLPGGELLTTNGARNTATIADARSGSIIAELSTGAKPGAAAFDSKTGHVFVMDAQDSEATVIDPKRRTVVGHVPIGGTLGSAVADGEGRLYVNVEDETQVAQIAVLDSVRRKIVAHYSLPECDLPSGIGFDPTTRLLLSVCNNEKAIALRVRDGSVAGTLDIGRMPEAVIFDAARRMFFVPCARDATMVAIETNNGEPVVVRKIPTAIGARTGALDPEAGELYLPAADYDLGPAGFTQKPGTFRILIVGSPGV
jgi:DNA-binding beta-propeller fold protein YncE